MTTYCRSCRTCFTYDWRDHALDFHLEQLIAREPVEFVDVLAMGKTIDPARQR